MIEINEHVEYYSISDILSNIGGIYTSVIGISLFIYSFFMKKKLMVKFIERLTKYVKNDKLI